MATTQEVIDGLRQLPASERLVVIEVATRMVREDWERAARWDERERRQQQLAAAAAALQADYAAGGELTAFTALDSREFSSCQENLQDVGGISCIGEK
jgi:hypothetical protein